MPKIKYAEGDVFAVPLSRGWAVVVIARARKGLAFGYFFGPRCRKPSACPAVTSLHPSGAMWRGIFGDPGIVSGEWPRLGRIADWNPQRWPMPAFRQQVQPYGRWVRVTYGDDPSAIGEREMANEADVEGLPDDGMSGSVAVSKKLDAMLD